jgi:hypothetical protein
MAFFKPRTPVMEPQQSSGSSGFNGPLGPNGKNTPSILVTGTPSAGYFKRTALAMPTQIEPDHGPAAAAMPVRTDAFIIHIHHQSAGGHGCGTSNFQVDRS